MIKRRLYCSNCNREIQDGEEIYAKMKAPAHIVMVEIKAYLKKNSEMLCSNCFNHKERK